LHVAHRYAPGPAKRFAQSIGAAFTVVATLLWFGFGEQTAALALVAVIAVFAALEGALRLCVGCRVFYVAMRISLIPPRVCADCAELLDIHTDVDHNRTVYTLVGDARQLVDALVAGVAVARERVDLRGHAGVHPRTGVADVVPIVPVRPADMDRAKAASLELARRLGDELSLPGFLYG